MRKLFTHILSVVTLLGIYNSGLSQVLPNLGGQRAGLATMTFLKNDMNPRSLALGGASLALSPDGFSTWSNPSLIADFTEVNISVSDYLVGGGLNQAFISGIIPTKGASVFGVSINTLSTGAMKVRTEFMPDGTGQQIYGTDMAVGLTYAQRLSDMFTFGATLKYLNEQLAEYSVGAVAFDLAFTYQTDWKDLAFGVMIQNFGGGSSITGDYLEVDFNRDSLNMSTNNYSVPNVFRFGFALTAWEKDDHHLTFAFELQHPNDNAENFRGALEYNFKEFLYGRVGYKLNVKGQTMPTFGIGLNTSFGAYPLAFNYAINPTNYMGTQQCFGISFTFNSEERE